MKFKHYIIILLIFAIMVTSCSPSGNTNETPSASDPMPAGVESPEIEFGDVPRLTTLSAQPGIAAPGETVVFKSADLVAGELKVYADGFDPVNFDAGSTQLVIPGDAADGRYYAALLTEGVPVAYVSFQVASQAGVWLSTDRSYADGVNATKLHVRAHELPEGLLASIFISETAGEEPIPYVPDDSGVLKPGSLVPLEQVVDRQLLLPAGVHGNLLVQVEPDYYAESPPEEATWQSEIVDLSLCTSPGSLSGSIEGPGLVNAVWADGNVRSMSQFVDSGEFSFNVEPGFVLVQLVTGIDTDSINMNSQLVFVGCGEDLRVDKNTGQISISPSSNSISVAALYRKPLFRPVLQAGGNDPCRKAFIFPVVTIDGDLDIDLSDAAGLALKTAIINLAPRIEVTTYSDHSALIEALAEAQVNEDMEAEISALDAVMQSVQTDFLVGLTSAKLGSSFPVAISGQAQLPGDASVRASGSGSSSSIRSPSFAAYQSFAESLSHAAICGTVEPESKKVVLGEEVEIDYFVTDLTGEPLDGVNVSISNPVCGELEPRDGSTENGLFETTYTYPDDQTCVENLDFSSEWNGPSGGVKTMPMETIVHLYPEPITMQIYVGHDPSVGGTSNIVATVIPTFPPRPDKTAPGSLPRFSSTGTCGTLEGGKEVVNDYWFVRDEFEAQRAEASINVTPVIEISQGEGRASSEEAGNDHFVISFVNKALSIPPGSDGIARSASGFTGNYVDWFSGDGFPGTIFLIDIQNPDNLPNFKPVIRWDALIDQWGEGGNSYEVIVMYKLVSCSNPLKGGGLGNMLTTGQTLIILSDADGGKRSGEFSFPEIKDEHYQIAFYFLNVAAAGSVRDDKIGMYSSGMTRLELLLDLYLEQEVPE